MKTMEENDKDELGKCKINEEVVTEWMMRHIAFTCA